MSELTREQFMEWLKRRADNTYCESLRISLKDCRGLQVLHKFTEEVQQQKLKSVRKSEQLMGQHQAFSEVLRELGKGYS